MAGQSGADVAILTPRTIASAADVGGEGSDRRQRQIGLREPSSGYGEELIAITRRVVRPDGA